MNLLELINTYGQRPSTGVPDWMLGYYKRYAISFATGETDLQTQVCWLQSRNFTIDLRLPIASEQLPAKPWADYSAEELRQLGNYEGWEALCDWDGDILSWRDTDCSLQFHNRWIEPGIIKRFGNCMIELAPSGAYVEDWRIQPSAPGVLAGLRLVEERDLATGEVRHSGGGLIVCGDYAGLVLGRNKNIAPNQSYNALRSMAVAAQGDAAQLAALFNFETSVAQGSIESGYKIALSTQPARVGESLCSLDGFELVTGESGANEQQRVRQTLDCDGIPCERIFTIDTLEANIGYESTTSFTPAAEIWFAREAQTLTRYTKPVY
jgi:hypothetical protein